MLGLPLQLLEEQPQSFFFLLSPPGWIRFDRPQTADPLIDGGEFGEEPLEPMIFRYLFGGLLKRGRSRKRFGNTILFDFAQYPKLLVAS